MVARAKSKLPPNWGARAKKYTPEAIERWALSLTVWVEVQISRVNNAEYLFKQWCFDEHFNPRYMLHCVERSENFRKAYELAQEWQEHYITKHALEGRLNAKFAGLMLTRFHGWGRIDSENDFAEALRQSFAQSSALFAMFNENPMLLQKLMSNPALVDRLEKEASAETEKKSA